MAAFEFNQNVRDKQSGKLGHVTGVRGLWLHIVDVEWDNGTTSKGISEDNLLKLQGFYKAPAPAVLPLGPSASFNDSDGDSDEA